LLRFSFSFPSLPFPRALALLGRRGVDPVVLDVILLPHILDEAVLLLGER
jgi:hypothetical protein